MSSLTTASPYFKLVVFLEGFSVHDVVPEESRQQREQTSLITHNHTCNY